MARAASLVTTGQTVGGTIASVDPTTGETHLRHHVSPDGFYRGRKVVDK